MIGRISKSETKDKKDQSWSYPNPNCPNVRVYINDKGSNVGLYLHGKTFILDPGQVAAL